ncbi:MAG TPA: hypothetical protein VGH43_11110 [Jatrophihabitans sp.]|jgi:hypothetical protein
MSSSVLLLTGAVGAGKSDASYRVFSRLWRAGTTAARLDLDDLGMCHPTPEDGPDNHRVKAAVMGGAWSVYLTRGARYLVLAGGVLTEAEFDLYRNQVPDASWTVVRLRLADDVVRRARILGRGTDLGMTARETTFWIDAGRAEEQGLEGQTFCDYVIDTDALDHEAVADRVLAVVGWNQLTA